MKPGEVQVQIYKPNGKFVCQHEGRLPQLRGWFSHLSKHNFVNLLHKNHIDIHFLSPMEGGFVAGYYYCVERISVVESNYNRPNKSIHFRSIIDKTGRVEKLRELEKKADHLHREILNYLRGDPNYL